MSDDTTTEQPGASSTDSGTNEPPRRTEGAPTTKIIDYGDTVIAPSGERYRVWHIYTDSDGIARVQLRRKWGSHVMYPSVIRLRGMLVRDGWKYIPDDHEEWDV